MKSVLHTFYAEKVVPAMQRQRGYKNIMQVPKLVKVIVNVGYGKHAKEQAYIDNVEKTLTVITGQKPVHHKSKKSISNFKIKEGQAIGASVTLRGEKMYDFLYKLIHLTFPRVRDFRGVSPSGFDRNGNYTVGFKENIAFPEVKVDSADKIHGLEVIIVTTAKDKQEGTELLSQLGIPFKTK
jgi:large subunit ribosomal protein L5